MAAPLNALQMNASGSCNIQVTPEPCMKIKKTFGINDKNGSSCGFQKTTIILKGKKMIEIILSF